MLSQNTKNLTIQQIKRLIENNGVKADGTEYCLDALNAALFDKQAKRNTKYESSPEYITAQVNAALNATTIFPPAMPVKAKSSYKAESITKPFLFQFSAPLWQVEKLTLDERLQVFKYA